MFRASVDRAIRMKILVLADLHVDEITDPDYLRRLGEAIRNAGKDADACWLPHPCSQRESRSRFRTMGHLAVLSLAGLRFASHQST